MNVNFSRGREHPLQRGEACCRRRDASRARALSMQQQASKQAFVHSAAVPSPCHARSAAHDSQNLVHEHRRAGNHSDPLHWIIRTHHCDCAWFDPTPYTLVSNAAEQRAHSCPLTVQKPLFPHSCAPHPRIDAHLKALKEWEAALRVTSSPSNPAQLAQAAASDSVSKTISI